MPKRFSVSMYNVRTIPLEQVPTKHAGVKIEHFDDESKALEFANINKNRYAVVTVKNQTGEVIVKYLNGKRV